MKHSGGPCRHSQEMQDQDFYAFKQLSTGLWVRIEGKCCSTACSGCPRKLQCCDDTLCWKKEERVSGREQTKNNWAESGGECGDWSISYKEKLRELELFIPEKTWPCGHKLKQVLSEYEEKLYCEDDWALGQSAQRGHGVSSPADIHQPPGAILCHLLQLYLLWQRGGTRWFPEVSSYSNHSVPPYAPLQVLV